MISYYSLGRIYPRDATRRNVDKQDRKFVRHGNGNRIQFSGKCKTTFVAKVSHKINAINPLTSKLTAKAKVIHKAKAIFAPKATKLTAKAKVIHKAKAIFAPKAKLTANIDIISKTTDAVSNVANAVANATVMATAKISQNISGNKYYVNATLMSCSKITGAARKKYYANVIIIGNSPKLTARGIKIIRSSSKIVVLAAITPRGSKLIRGGSIIIAARTTNKIKAEAIALWKECRLHFYSI